MNKKLYKSRVNQMLSGVCGGIGEYFNTDPTLIRLLWVLVTIMSLGFGGLIAYIICAIIIPENPNYNNPYNNSENQ